MPDPILAPLVQALSEVDGLVAVALGGSRARGTARPDSDYDIGLYYDAAAPLDTARLLAAVRPLVDAPTAAAVTPLGEWGPWINGGAWLAMSGHKVDLLYRDLDQVGAVIADCRDGRIAMHYQPGHPHGFCSAIWMGEAALCRPLFDPRGRIAALKALTSPYPDALRQALIARFHWEVRFSIDNAETALGREEQTHIAGCAYRALSCLAQVLFAVNGRYLINEKGAFAEAATLPATIAGAAAAGAEVWGAIGTRDFGSAIRRLRTLAEELDALVASSAEPPPAA